MGVDARIGALVAAYRIERVLGRGGMGVVYVAEDARLGRRVALKLLSPELAGDARFRERFVRESRLAASLEHPNIVPIHAAGEEGGVLFLAMRFIEGTDLRALVGEHGPLEVERAARIVAGVAAALDAAHGQGLVHRDVKPSNVLLRELGGQDHAYLADFGLTKPTSSMTGLTGTGQIVGTVDYLAPEVIEGKPADPRADQYALGCVLYECLVGRPPFGRETEAATLWAHMRDKPPATGVDAADAVLARALAKSPDARYPSCGEMVADLDRRLPKPIAPAGLSRRAKLLAAGAVAVLVAATAAVTALFSGGAAAAFKPAPPNTVVAIDAKTGKIVGKPIPVGRAPTQIVVSGNNVWVANAAGRSISWIDARTRKFVRTIPLHATPTGIAAGAGGSVWVDEGLARKVVEVGPRPYNYPPPIGMPWCCAGPSVIAVSGSSILVGDAEGIHRRGIAGSRWIRILDHPAAGGAAVGSDGTFWFTDGWSRVYAVLAGLTPAVENPSLPGGPSGVTVGAGATWIALPEAHQVVTETPATTPKVVKISGEPTSIAIGGGSAWVANAAGDLIPVGILEGRARPPIRVGGRLGGVAASGGTVWVAVQGVRATASAAGRLLFSPDRGAPWSISGFATIRADGTGNVRAARVGTDNGIMADVSPNRKDVVWVANDGVRRGRLGTQRSVRLAAQLANAGDYGPRWSPDGTQIAYLRDFNHRGSALVVMQADGSHSRVVHKWPQRFGVLAELDWTQDGELVAEEPQFEGGFLDLLDPSTGHATRITVGFGYSPRWSPDGTHVAYFSTVEGAGIYVTGVDGQRYKVLATPGLQNGSFGISGVLNWSPDGRQLTYAGYYEGFTKVGEDVWIVNADGSGATRLTNTAGQGATMPDWIPYR